MTLRTRFALALVVFSVVITTAGSVLAWQVMSGTLEEELDEKLAWLTGAAAGTGLAGDDFLAVTPGLEGGGFWSALQARLQGMEDFAQEAYVFRWSESGGGQALVTTRPPQEVATGTTLRFLTAYTSELDGARARGFAASPVFQDDDGVLYKYGFRRLGQTDAMLAVRVRADFLEPLAELRRSFLLGALAAAVLAALLAILLAANVVRPLERLSRAAIRIQRGRWDVPVTEERDDEVGRLARAMERMRKGVVQRDEQLRLMLAQVAHEIRNPLGGLELFAAAAADTDDPTERRRLIGRVRSEVEGLNAIINEFLVFARPLEPRVTLHDIRDPLREAADLADGGGNGDLDLDLRLPDAPLPVRADPDHVKRVTLNLLRNAAEVADRVRLVAEAMHGEVRVTVRDDGPGVDPELRDRVFEPFVTDREQGAGLGLAIVHRILETNGGRIELVDPDRMKPDPELGTGAEFRVYWPGADDLPAN